MLIDKELMFSDGQSIVGATGDIDSSVIDVVKEGSPYDNMWLFVKTGDAVASATSIATVKFALHTSSDGFSSDDTVLFSTDAIGVSGLTANTVIAKVRVPLGAKKDIKMVYTIAGEATTSGTVSAFFVGDVDSQL